MNRPDGAEQSQEIRIQRLALQDGTAKRFRLCTVPRLEESDGLIEGGAGFSGCIHDSIRIAGWDERKQIPPRQQEG